MQKDQRNNSFEGRGKRLAYLSTLMAGVMLGLVVAVFFYVAFVGYRATLDSTKQNLRFISSIVAGQIEKTLGGVEEVLNGLIAINDLIEGSHERYDAKLRELLIFLQEGNPHLLDLVVVDPDGTIRNWTGEGKPPYVGDRDYVTVHRDRRKRGMFIGKPLISRVQEGQWFFGVSKGIYAQDGSLKSVVVAIIDVESIYRMLLELDYPNDATILLANESGYVMTRVPGHEALVGKYYNLLEILADMGKSSDSFVTKSPFDGVERVVGYTRLNNIPLIAFASFSSKEALESWRHDTFLEGAVAAVMLLLLTLLSASLLKGQARLQQQRNELAIMASIDPLTGILNRRAFLDIMRAEFSRVRRYGSPFTFIMFDLDHFKNVNDRYGHEAGDRALLSVCQVVQESLRESDSFCRFGGEEFAILLPGTGEEGGMSAAEKLREAIESMRIDFGTDGFSVTASFGVSCGLETDHSEEAVISRADAGLYRAKDEGRNRVVFSGLPKTL